MVNNHTERPIRIGDIYLMNFGGSGSEQKGWRPGLVFQNNTGNTHSPNIIALPLTTAIKKTDQPTHVFVPADGTGLIKDSMILCENPETMSKNKLGNYLTTLPKEYMSKVAIANLLASSAISFIKPEILLNIWRKALTLNATA
jgi:mRNA interferase MazF